MPCALTQGYLLDCRLNFGGVKEVYVTETDNIASYTEAAGVVTVITKVATKVFRKYALVAHTGESDDAFVSNLETGTQMSKQSVKFPINKMTTAVRNELLLLAQNRLVFVVVDLNGTNWIYGKDFGLTLASASGKTGKALGDRNGYELAFEGDEKALCQEYSGTLASLIA